MDNADGGEKRHYAAVWRWHFYAGLFVAPFLMMLALTGLVILAKEPLERWQLGALQSNVAAGLPISHQERLEAVRRAYFYQVEPSRYQPGRSPEEAARVTITIGDRPFSVFVDAGTGQVLGSFEDSRRIGEVATRIHGTLLMGTWGDRLIEIAASLGILLIVSGLYLYFPGWNPARWLARKGGPRASWRGFHRTTGVLLAPVLAFYLFTGLAWTGVWGEKLVQGWATLGAAQAPPGRGAVSHHEALNSGSGKVVPWNLEQAPMPEPGGHSHGDAGAAGNAGMAAGHSHGAAGSAGQSYPSGARIWLDDAITLAQREGIGDRFWVGLPKGGGGVFTVAQTAMNGDVSDPRRELIVHLDPHTGEVVGRVHFSDYGLVAKGMAAGVPFHMGSLGGLNFAAGLAVCLAVFALAFSGLAAWWRRRPATGRLGAPPGPAPAQVPPAMWALIGTFALLFPLGGAALVAIAALDWLLLRRIPGLARLLS